MCLIGESDDSPPVNDFTDVRYDESLSLPYRTCDIQDSRDVFILSSQQLPLHRKSETEFKDQDHSTQLCRLSLRAMSLHC